jgi:hypothetical protein
MSSPRTAARESTFVLSSVPTQEQATGGTLQKGETPPFPPAHDHINSMVDMVCRFVDIAGSSIQHPRAVGVDVGVGVDD